MGLSQTRSFLHKNAHFNRIRDGGEASSHSILMQWTKWKKCWKLRFTGSSGTLEFQKIFDFVWSIKVEWYAGGGGGSLSILYSVTVCITLTYNNFVIWCQVCAVGLSEVLIFLGLFTVLGQQNGTYLFAPTVPLVCTLWYCCSITVIHEKRNYRSS